MANELTVVDTDTRLGAVKREAHWSIVIAATGGGLTFTWLGHLMEWTPLGFAVHGITGAVGGYLVGTGVARLVTGTRVRPIARKYLRVGFANRIVASGLRSVFGVAFFALSYLWAIGFDLSVITSIQPEMIGFVAPMLVWGFILLFTVGRRLVQAAR